MRDLSANSYCRVVASPAYRVALSAVKEAASTFFTEPIAYKRRFESANHGNGYRAFGIEYSLTPDRPDRNEAFAYWPETDEAMAVAGGAEEFRDALSRFRMEAAMLAQKVIDAICAAYAADLAPSTTSFSYVQVNFTSPELTGELSQDRHEDGHLLTLHNASGPGLMLHRSDGSSMPIEPDPDSVVVMAGSTLTVMTGGEIQPAYHSVRCPRSDHPRIATMYFVNLDPREHPTPFVVNEANRGIDVAEHVNSFPARFGLPKLVEW